MRPGLARSSRGVRASSGGGRAVGPALALAFALVLGPGCGPEPSDEVREDPAPAATDGTFTVRAVDAATGEALPDATTTWLRPEGEEPVALVEAPGRFPVLTRSAGDARLERLEAQVFRVSFAGGGLPCDLTFGRPVDLAASTGSELVRTLVERDPDLSVSDAARAWEDLEAEGTAVLWSSRRVAVPGPEHDLPGPDHSSSVGPAYTTYDHRVPPGIREWFADEYIVLLDADDLAPGSWLADWRGVVPEAGAHDPDDRPGAVAPARRDLLAFEPGQGAVAGRVLELPPDSGEWGSLTVRVHDQDPSNDEAEGKSHFFPGTRVFQVPVPSNGPLCLSVVQASGRGFGFEDKTLHLGQVDGVQPLPKGLTWVGDVSLPEDPTLTLQVDVDGPAADQVRWVAVELFQSGARTMRRPGSEHRVVQLPGVPNDVHGLPDDVWRVAPVLERTRRGQDLWVDGDTPELLKMDQDRTWHRTLRVRRAATLELELPDGWPSAGPHVLTLIDGEERHDRPLDVRPDGRILWNVPPRVPCGTWWVYLRSDRQDAPGRDATWERVEVGPEGRLVLRPSAGLVLVEEPRPGQAARPFGRPLRLADPEGVAFGEHARILTRRRPDGSAVSGVLSVEMTLVDEETGAVVFDRGVPAEGYRVE